MKLIIWLNIAQILLRFTGSWNRCHALFAQHSEINWQCSVDIGYTIRVDAVWVCHELRTRWCEIKQVVVDLPFQFQHIQHDCKQGRRGERNNEPSYVHWAAYYFQTINHQTTNIYFLQLSLHWWLVSFRESANQCWLINVLINSVSEIW